MDLLACEITAKEGKDPGELYKEMEKRFGTAFYERIDIPATREEKAALKKLSPDQIREKDLAGDPIVARLTRAPGNDADIGGIKVVSRNGWFAARPSGTEDICKIYTESFRSEEHLRKIQAQAMETVTAAYKEKGSRA